MPNRLAHETSTYLQQHADNPVDWWPWCDEALALARREQRPILLSIGYAACHWCHVMAHESFEDAATAARMNAEFINIKVDRQTRPDLDHVYQAVHQAMTGRPGGWPLTIFLTAELTPIYAGTYFPRQARYGLPDFTTLLDGVARAAREEATAIAEQGERLRAFFARSPAASPAEEALAGGAAAARDALLAAFDHRHGGFGGAPKFPQPTSLALLADLGDQGDAEAAAAVDFTLSRMAGSGLFDQIGGGFFRYCVDGEWTIPHFEKMLYDNALLLPLYADTAVRRGRARDVAVCAATIDWLLAELRAPDGTYFAALDADSEGEEGRYYRWRASTVRELVGEPDWPLVAAHFGFDRPANFEGLDWHATAWRALDAPAAAPGIDPAEAEPAIERARRLLLAHRRERVPPGRDGQRLTAWNALVASGLARAGRRLRRPDWIAAAVSVGRAICARVTAHDGVPVSLDGGGAGFLDDHAFALAALLDLIEIAATDPVTGDPSDLERLTDAAAALAARLTGQFQADDGRLHLTAATQETVLFRAQTIHDQALPAGAAVAIAGLATWAAWSGDPSMHDAAVKAAGAHAAEALDYPAAAATFWRAVRVLDHGAPTVVLRGPQRALDEWLRALAPALPNGVRLVCHTNESPARLPSALHKPPATMPQALWCAAGICQPPIDSLEALMKQFETLRRNTK